MWECEGLDFRTTNLYYLVLMEKGIDVQMFNWKFVHSRPCECISPTKKCTLLEVSYFSLVDLMCERLGGIEVGLVCVTACESDLITVANLNAPRVHAAQNCTQ